MKRIARTIYLFIWYVLQKDASKALQIRAFTDKEVLLYLWYGYSLEMLMRDDIDIRLMENKYITEDEREYYHRYLWLYEQIYAMDKRGDASYMLYVFAQPNEVDYSLQTA
jgi:hypothetical protein